MADVGVRVTVEGAEQAKAQLEGVNKAIEDAGTAAQKTSGPLDAVSEGFKKLAPDLADASSGLGRLAELAPIVGTVLGAAAVTGVAYFSTQLINAIHNTVELGDQLNNLSQRTGVAVETLSGGLRLAAETSGSSIEGLATGLQHLNRSIAEAADGQGKAADTFARLGISVRDTSGNLKSADEILFELAERFSGAEDGATKTEAAMTLLGRSGAALIPTLNEGAAGLAQLEREAKLAGITMSGETAEAAAKLNENMRVLRAYGEGFWQGVAAPIIDGLVKITGAMRAARGEGEGFFASFMEGAKKAIEVIFFPDANDKLKTNQDRMAGVLKSIGYLESLPQRNDLQESSLSLMKDELAKLMQESQTLQGIAQIEAAWEKTGSGAFLTGGGATTVIPPPVSRPKTTTARERSPDEIALSFVSREIGLAQQQVQSGEWTADQYYEWLRDMEAGWSQFESARIKLSAESSKTISKMLLDEEKQMIDRDATIRREALANNKARLDDLKEVQREIEKAASLELRAINDTTYMFKSEKLAAMEEVRQKYEEMGERGELALKKIDQEIATVTGSHRTAGVLIQDVGFNMMNVWKGVHGALESTIAETTRWLLGLDSSIKSLGDALKSFAISVVNTMINEFAKLAANEVFRWLFGDRKPGGAGGGLLGGALDWLGSAIFGGGGSGGGGGGGSAAGASGGFLGGLWDTVKSVGSTIFGGSSAAGGGGTGAATGGGGGILGMLGAAASGIGKLFGFGGSSAAAATSIGTGAMDMGIGMEGLWDYMSPGGDFSYLPTAMSESAVAGWSETLAGSFTDTATEPGIWDSLKGLFGGGSGGGGGGLFGGITGGIGGSIQDLGVSLGSQTITDIGASIAEGGFGSVMPFLGGALKIFQGDIGGGVGSTIGGLLGSTFGPVGSAVGSFLGGKLLGGLFGDDEPMSILQGYRLQGSLGPGGFQGQVTAYDQLGNTWDATQGSPDGVWAPVSIDDLSGAWAEKLPGASVSVPIDTTVGAGWISGGQDWVPDYEGGARMTGPVDEEYDGPIRRRTGDTEGGDDGIALTDPMSLPGEFVERQAIPTFSEAASLLSGIMDELAAARFSGGIQQFATGGDAIFTRPTPIMVGHGAERVQVTPLAGAQLRGGGTTVQIQGMSLMDTYAARRMYYELQRVQQG